MERGRSCHFLNRAGQQTAEFALLIGLAAAAALGMQIVVRKAVSQGVQAVTDQTLGYFSARPSVISRGGRTTLRWNVPRAFSCAASGGTTRGSDGVLREIPGWNGDFKPPKGEDRITNIENTMTFRLRCTGASGEPSLVTTVTIGDLDATSSQTATERGDAGFDRTTTISGSSTGTAVNEVQRVRRLAE